MAAPLGDLEVDVAQDALDGGGEARTRPPAGRSAIDAGLAGRIVQGA